MYVALASNTSSLELLKGRTPNPKSKEEKDILDAIKKKNPNINITKLEYDFDDVEEFSIAIDKWDKSQISTYMKKIKGSPNLVSDRELMKTLSVVRRAMYLATGNERPRFVQMLSLLSLLNATDKGGRLAQINTGEGKTMTIAMLAAIKVLQGHKVDIVTSSEVLAKRDVEKQAKFYKLLGLTFAHNINEGSPNGPKDYYKRDIVYGTAHSFQADILQDEYKHRGTMAGRKQDVVIVDEVDNMLIDEHNTSTLLAEEKPFMDQLVFILVKMWECLIRVDNSQVSSKDLVDRLVNIATFLIKGEPDKNNPIVKLPEYLKAFVTQRLEEWSKSAIFAKTKCIENRHYIINEGKIENVDYRNTGIIQKNTTLDNGVHQFLQLKHGLKITPENITTNYLSNVGFFKRYEKQIYGLTGTLGSESAKDKLAGIYKVDFVEIPPFTPRRFDKLDDIITCSQDDWHGNILESIEYHLKNKKAVLVICESIRVVNDLEVEVGKYFTNERFPDIKVFSYKKNDNDDCKVLESEIKPWTVILATNLAGRGTDITFTKEVEENGGLHVCLTFIPTNLRVENQALGRASRKGQPGSGQMILNYYHEVAKLGFNNKESVDEALRQISILEDLSYQLLREPGLEEDLRKLIKSVPKKDITSLKHFRDEFEKKVLQEVEEQINRVLIRDDLFNWFCKLINEEMKELHDDPISLAYIEERWAMWLKLLDTNLTMQQTKEKFENFRTGIKLDHGKGLISNPCYLNKIAAIDLSSVILPFSRTILDPLKYLVGWGKNKYKINQKVYGQTPDKLSVYQKVKIICGESQTRFRDSFIPYYYVATAILQEKEVKDYKKEALKFLENSLKNIDNEIGFMCGFFFTLSTHDNKEQLVELQKRLTIYEKIKEIIMINIKEVNAAIGSHRGVVSRRDTIENFFKNSPDFKDQVNQLKLRGLDYIFLLTERVSLWTVGKIIGLGILQIAVAGVMLLIPPLAPFAVPVAVEGCLDIIRGTVACIGGKYSFSEHCTQKVVGYSIGFLFAGADFFATPITDKIVSEVGGQLGFDIFRQSLFSLAQMGRTSLNYLLSRLITNNVSGATVMAVGSLAQLVPSMFYEGPDTSVKIYKLLADRQAEYSRQEDIIREVFSRPQEGMVFELVNNNVNLEEYERRFEEALIPKVSEELFRRLRENRVVKALLCMKASDQSGSLSLIDKLNHDLERKVSSELQNYGEIIKESIGNSRSVASNLDSLLADADTLANSIADKIESQVISGIVEKYENEILAEEERLKLELERCVQQRVVSVEGMGMVGRDSEDIELKLQEVTAQLEATTRRIGADVIGSVGGQINQLLANRVTEDFNTANIDLKDKISKLVSSNPFNQSRVKDYEFQGPDIKRIANQLMKGYTDIIVHCLDQNKLVDVVKEKTKPIMGIYKTQSDCIAYSVIRIGDGVAVLYKDSYNGNESFENTIHSINPNVIIKHHCDFYAKDLKSTGVYALKNLQIMADEFRDREDPLLFIKYFQFLEFCYNGEARMLRMNYSKLYAINVYERMKQSDLTIEKVSLIKKHHNKELLQLSAYLSDRSKEYKIETNQNPATETYKKTIFIEIMVQLDEKLQNYEYCYTFSWSEDISTDLAKPLAMVFRLKDSDYVSDKRSFCVAPGSLSKISQLETKVYVDKLNVTSVTGRVFERLCEILNVSTEQSIELLSILKSYPYLTEEEMKYYQGIEENLKKSEGTEVDASVITTVKEMLRDGVPIGSIMKWTKLSEQIILKIKKSN
jgi:preprotein translocase subunit SecA